MNCSACNVAQANDTAYFFRWGLADIKLIGCREHIEQVMEVLRSSQQDIREKENK